MLVKWLTVTILLYFKFSIFFWLHFSFMFSIFSPWISREIYIFSKHSGKPTYTLKLGENCQNDANFEALHANSNLVYTTTVFKHKAIKPAVSLSRSQKIIYVVALHWLYCWSQRIIYVVALHWLYCCMRTVLSYLI